LSALVTTVFCKAKTLWLNEHSPEKLGRKIKRILGVGLD